MLLHHLKVALRHVRRQKGYAALNVGGLALGLACAFLITLYVRHELAYDRHHANAERIYRITSEVQLAGEYTHYVRASPVVAAALQAADPAVEATVRLQEADAVVKAGTRRFFRERTFYADASFFRVFTAPFVSGSAATALTAPGQAVLTQRAARRYFGAADPVGGTIYLGSWEAPVEVVGVIEDAPEASHLHYDVLVSMANLLPIEPSGPEAWVTGVNQLTYVLLRPGARPEALEARAASLVERTIGSLVRQFKAQYVLHLQPLTSIHLHSNLMEEAEPGGDVLYVYVFGTVALIVLLIACINFTNLATARALNRAREVGLRKALGAGRGELIRQFLAESFALTLAAFVLAAGLAWALLPVFNDLTGRSLTFAGTLGAFGLLAAGVPVVALLAGAYPAFVLSSYVPVETLRGGSRSGPGGLALRRVLVVTQFALSVVLVAGSFVVQRQLAFTRAQRLGFDTARVVVLPLEPDEGVRAQEAAFKAAVLASPSVEAATLTDNYPAGPNENNSPFVPGGKPDEASALLWVYDSDFDLVRTLGLGLAWGRALDARRGTDSTAFLLNEAAVRVLGMAAEEGAEVVELLGGPGGTTRLAHPVVGVVRDFHTQSFRHAIRPVVIRLGSTPGFQYNYLLVRVRPGGLEPALAHLKTTWARFSNGTPFNPSFLDAEFDALYRNERQLGKAFGYFTVLATLIACLGLLGLSAHATERRRKEIGVRKVLGASVPGLVGLLARDFARPVGLAVVLAAPVAYFAAERWLGSFAYRTPLGPGPFVLAGALALAVALVTVSLHTVRAATADPVRALRSE